MNWVSSFLKNVFYGLTQLYSFVSSPLPGSAAIFGESISFMDLLGGGLVLFLTVAITLRLVRG